MKILSPENIIRYKIENIKCNCCGKLIEKDDNGYFADYLSVTKNWGYGSDYDTEQHSFDICQDCYNKLISKFKIPPDKTKKTEF